jgi:hypothetical protein
MSVPYKCFATFFFIFSVEVPKFFAPVTNLLLPVERRTTWKGMRTVAQIKRENNIQVTRNLIFLREMGG